MEDIFFEEFPKSMFRDWNIKLIFLIIFMLTMRFVGVPWWNSSVYGLFVVFIGGIVIYLLGHLTGTKKEQDKEG